MSSTRSSEEREERTGDECCLEEEEEEEEEEKPCISCGLIGYNKRKQQVFDYWSDEIEEDEDDDLEELFEINLNLIKEPLDTIIEDCESTVFSIDIHASSSSSVYVAVGHHHVDSSMGALSWALKHAVTPSITTVYLVHVFPEIKLIPSPLGKIPRSHVNVQHVNHYLHQKKGKTKLLLQKFIDLCVDSKVKVELILIEGDNVAAAIADLVVKHDIRKLVIGTTGSNLRRRNGIANKVFKNAQESCDVKIICEGRVVLDEMMIGYNSSSSRSKESNSSSSSSSQDEDEPRAVAPLIMRFMAYPIWLFRPRFSSPR